MRASTGALVAELGELLRIPSVSADPDRAADVRHAADWVRAYVEAAGGRAAVVERGGAPLVLGHVEATREAATAPTVLVYGHVDVQPPGDEGLWTSPPFEPIMRGEWLYARGAADDKGNAYLLLRAVRELRAAGELPVNVRIVFDGEEEIGGATVVEHLATDEPADAAVIFDAPMPARDVPALVLANRGLVYLAVTVRTGLADLHSGSFGGAAANAAHVLMAALQRLVGAETLPGEPLPLDAEERAGLERLPAGVEILEGVGVAPADERAAEELHLRTKARSAVDVNGIETGEARATKTVLPVFARANVSIRVAAGVDAEAVAAWAEERLRDGVPDGVALDVDRRCVFPAGVLPRDPAVLGAARAAFETTMGRTPLSVRTGGALPVAAALGARGVPTVLTGFDVPEGNIHAPDERLLLRYLRTGVDTARALLSGLATIDRIQKSPAG